MQKVMRKFEFCSATFKIARQMTRVNVFYAPNECRAIFDVRLTEIRFQSFVVLKDDRVNRGNSPEDAT